MTLQGAIFDFDGVLFDTEKHHEVCWRKVAEILHKSISREQFLKGFGVKNDRFIREILQWTDSESEIERISRMKEELFQEYIKKVVIDPIDGTIRLVQRLFEARIPCVIGSSSIRKNIELIMSHHPEMAHKFLGVISSENVSQGKPHPDVFLKAAELAGSEPKHAVVFEDAPLGIQAAKNAGICVVGLTTTFPAETLAHEKPDLILSDFSELSLKTLHNVVLQRQG